MSDYAFEDTAIEQGGVMRCCIGTVGLEYEGKLVKLGDKSKCSHCKESFTLVMVTPPMTSCYLDPKLPIWKPDWQLK